MLGSTHNIPLNSHNNSHMRGELSIFFESPEMVRNLPKGTQIESGLTDLCPGLFDYRVFLFLPHHCINIVCSLGISCS